MVRPLSPFAEKMGSVSLDSLISFSSVSLSGVPHPSFTRGAWVGDSRLALIGRDGCYVGEKAASHFLSQLEVPIAALGLHGV